MRKPYISKLHYILEVIGYLLCVLALVYAIVKMNTTEGEIPTHYTLDGVADAYGSASSLLILPGFMAGTMLVMSACLHLIPSRMWNTGFKVNPEKENIVLSDFAYMIASMFPCMGLYTAVVTFFFLKGGVIIGIATGVLIVSLFMLIAIFMIKAYRDNLA